MFHRSRRHDRSTRPPRLALGAAFFAAVALTTAGAARADAAPAEATTTAPADGSTVGGADRIAVTFTAPLDGATAQATVYSAAHEVEATGTLVPDASSSTFVMPAPGLAAGPHTVTWTAGTGADAVRGTFAFNVDPALKPPTSVRGARPTIQLRPVKRVGIAWAPWVAVMVMVGALALRFAVTAPSARRLPGHAGGAVQGTTDRRLAAVAAAAAAVLLPASLLELAYAAGGNTSFAFGRTADVIGADGAGHLWGFRLAVTTLALVALAAAVVRPAGRARLLGAALVLGVLELAARVVPSGIPANWPRTIFGDLFTFAHIGAAAVWIGGLAGLVAIAVGRAVPAPERAAFWRQAFRRFSFAAMTCVGLVTLSGLWLSWIHVDGLSQLRGTLYGRTLLVKLAGVAALVSLGAFNHLWLKPRMETRPAAGVDGLVRRHVRTVVGVEVLLGLAVLFAVPYLSGSARNQTFQTRAADLARTAPAGDRTVTLRPSGLVAGQADYDVVVAGAATGTVALTFAADDLGVPARTVPAAQVEPGHFRATGLYAPMAGTWTVGVRLDGAAADAASFPLKVTAKAVPLPRAPAPKIGLGTWLWGIAACVAVFLSLFAATRLARRSTTRLRRLAASGVGLGGMPAPVAADRVASPVGTADR